jgi:tetratricopeptide (TPR) repeat protein
MNKKQFLIVQAIVGACLVLSAEARASTHAHEARVLYQKGNKAFREGDSILARDFYAKSLAMYESFDTRCNYGRALYEDKLYLDAYENLSMCVGMYPDDADLADARAKFKVLQKETRTRLSVDEVQGVDEKVEKAVAAWLAAQEGPDSGLGSDDDPASPPPAAASEPNRWKRPVVFSLAGAGVVGGVVGSVLLVRSGTLMRDAEELQGRLGKSGCASSGSADCADLDSTLHKADSSKNAGVAVLAGGGALLVGALVVYLVVPDEKKSERAQIDHGWASIRPGFGVAPGGLSLSLSGSF